MLKTTLNFNSESISSINLGHFSGRLRNSSDGLTKSVSLALNEAREHDRSE